jgi:hypothetical protein
MCTYYGYIHKTIRRRKMTVYDLLRLVKIMRKRSKIAQKKEAAAA